MVCEALRGVVAPLARGAFEVAAEGGHAYRLSRRA